MVKEMVPAGANLKDIIDRLIKAVEERERRDPGAYAREQEEIKQEEENQVNNRMLGVMREGMFSEHHIRLVMGMQEEKLDESNPIIVKTKIFEHEYNPGTKPWTFMASQSGSGKTTAIHRLILGMLKRKKIVAPGYVVHSDFIEACFNRKAKIDDLYRYDLLVIDDFFKKAFESGSMREQDLIKKLIDYFYRFRKGLVICADVPMDDIHDRLDKDEYADQICYRILEKCGYKKDRRFVYGWNDLPNMRK